MTDPRAVLNAYFSGVFGPDFLIDYERACVAWLAYRREADDTKEVAIEPAPRRPGARK